MRKVSLSNPNISLYHALIMSGIAKGNEYVCNCHHTPFMDDGVILSHICNLLRLIVLQWYATKCGYLPQENTI